LGFDLLFFSIFSFHRCSCWWVAVVFPLEHPLFLSLLLLRLLLFLLLLMLLMLLLLMLLWIITACFLFSFPVPSSRVLMVGVVSPSLFRMVVVVGGRPHLF
jgi:hypothetical protein